MTISEKISERKKNLLEQLRNERERKGQLTDALEQAKANEQQLIGAITILEQLEREAPVVEPVVEPEPPPVAYQGPVEKSPVKKNDGA